MGKIKGVSYRDTKIKDVYSHNHQYDLVYLVSPQYDMDITKEIMKYAKPSVTIAFVHDPAKTIKGEITFSNHSYNDIIII